MLKRVLTHLTDKIYNLPVLVIMPHSRCNCRCVMCDIWKANQTKKEISPEELSRHVREFKKLGVREIVLSGGEALMHSNLWRLCTILREQKIKITLLSTGLLLERNAAEIIENVQEVIVSIDGSPAVHDRIRNIPSGFHKLVAGVQALKKLKPHFRVTARCVLQRLNYRDLINIIKTASETGIDQLSFLAADVSTTAFNHPEDGTAANEISLNSDEALEFERIVEQSFLECKHEYESGFVAERPEKMRKIVRYYKAINGLGEFPTISCNAPWVSAVIESDGNVMPCFFHKPYGSIYDQGFLETLNSRSAISFRKNLDVATDPICKKCVCTLKLRIHQMN
jgi:Fe-coproporphyrin III synthase